MFIVIIHNLNNENIVTLSIYAPNYDDWWKHDGFGHVVTSIGLSYPTPI